MPTFNLPLLPSGHAEAVAAMKTVWGERAPHPVDGAMFRVIARGVQESPETTLAIQWHVNGALHASGVWAGGIAPVCVVFGDDGAPAGLSVEPITIRDGFGRPLQTKRQRAAA